MLITSYYRGGTDRLTGLTFDTEKKVYRTWQLKAEDWMYLEKGIGWIKRKGFKIPGDIDFFQQSQAEVFREKNRLDTLGFANDPDLKLNFTKE